MDCTLIDCHSTIDNEILLLAGSNYEKGKCLRSLVYRNGTLVPSTDFVGNKQIIRASLFNKQVNFGLNRKSEMNLLNFFIAD